MLSSWGIGHTTRFAGAAVRCPVTNWLSMTGTTDIPLCTHNFFATPFCGAPEQWLKQSPLMHVGNVADDVEEPRRRELPRRGVGYT